MDFVNRTELPADLMVGSTGDREMLSIVASKATYRIEGRELEGVDDDEAWPIFDKPFEFRGLTLAPDLDYRKEGTDLLLFGNAVAPGRNPVEAMWAVAESGSFRYRVAVYGDRVWMRSGRNLVPSRPTPFVEMTLSNDRTFGGVGAYEGQEMPHPVNPDGRGFYCTEEEAEGSPLPNVERPDQLVGSWEDRPTPACLLPPAGSMELSPERLQKGDPMEEIAASLGPSFNQAVPDLVVDPESLSDVLHLEGFSEEGALDLPLPPRTGPEAVAFVGDLASRFPSVLSTLVVLVPERVCVATYVSLFRYLFRPREKRWVELRPARAPVGAGKARSSQ